MSSPRTSFKHLKRRSEYDSSDSELEYVSPVKKIKTCNGGTTIKDTFTTRFKTIWQWISDLPIGDMFKETVRQRSNIIKPEVINIEDEDEDCDVIVQEKSDRREVISAYCTQFVDDSQDALLKTLASSVEYHPLSLKEKKRCTLSDLGYNKDKFFAPKPVCSSTPLYQCPSSSLQRRPINGGPCNSSNMPSTIRKYSTLTNPSNAVDIILDESEDELEIVDEFVSSRQILPQRPSSYQFGKDGGYKNTVKSYLSSHDRDETLAATSVRSDSSASGRKVRPSAYTAHEVVRLQEKEQYKILIDKMVSRSIYHPVIPREGSRISEVQIDSSEDSQGSEMVGTHFRKEVLQAPVSEFLQKYYKPCRLVSLQTKNHEAEFEGKDDDDDDIEVINEKPYKYEPKRKGQRSDFFSDKWIEEMKLTINSETEKFLENVAVQERKVERYRKRRDQQESEKARTNEIIWMKPAVDEFPDLTPAMENMIENAFGPGDGRELLCSQEGGNEIKRMDIATLHSLNWLNDEIINFYLGLIVQRSKLDNYPSVYAFNTFFYPSLKSKGFSGVMRWTRKVDIFSFDILVIPLHLGVHWALCTIDNRAKVIKYYDSMKSSEVSCLQKLQNYLVDELKHKKKISMEPTTYTLEVVKDNPCQMNGSDCGMFLLKYAEYVCRDAPITFTQENMAYFRRRMVYEILTQQLL